MLAQIKGFGHHRTPLSLQGMGLKAFGDPSIQIKGFGIKGTPILAWRRGFGNWETPASVWIIGFGHHETQDWLLGAGGPRYLLG